MGGAGSKRRIRCIGVHGAAADTAVVVPAGTSATSPVALSHARFTEGAPFLQPSHRRDPMELVHALHVPVALSELLLHVPSRRDHDRHLAECVAAVQQHGWTADVLTLCVVAGATSVVSHAPHPFPGSLPLPASPSQDDAGHAGISVQEEEQEDGYGYLPHCPYRALPFLPECLAMPMLSHLRALRLGPAPHIMQPCLCALSRHAPQTSVALLRAFPQLVAAWSWTQVQEVVLHWVRGPASRRLTLPDKLRLLHHLRVVHGSSVEAFTRCLRRCLLEHLDTATVRGLAASHAVLSHSLLAAEVHPWYASPPEGAGTPAGGEGAGHAPPWLREWEQAGLLRLLMELWHVMAMQPQVQDSRE